MSINIIIVTNNVQTKYNITGSVVLGRSNECDIVLDDNSCSGKHCVIHLTGDGLKIEDLESKNGTICNRVRISGARRIYSSDSISIGDSDILIDEKSLTPRERHMIVREDKTATRAKKSISLNLGPKERAKIKEYTSTRKVKNLKRIAKK